MVSLLRAITLFPQPTSSTWSYAYQQKKSRWYGHVLKMMTMTGSGSTWGGQMTGRMDKQTDVRQLHRPCSAYLPSVLWRCWLGGRKGIRPVKPEWWGAGVVVRLEWGADLHRAQLMPLPLTVSCFSKIQTGFTFLVLAHPDSPRQRAVKWMCVFCILCRAVPKIENGWLTVQSVYLYRRAVLLGPTQCHQRRSDQLAKTPAWLASMSVEHLSLSLHPPNSQSTPSNIS